jgi:hypothetical protein
MEVLALCPWHALSPRMFLTIMGGRGRRVYMEFDLYPSIAMQTGTFNALIAPEALAAAGLNDNPGIQRFLFLYVCGNFSHLLPAINRRSTNFEVQRAFTAYQLLSILQDSHHTVVFVEHDPSLYEGATEVLDPVAEALHDAGENTLVILYAPHEDDSFRTLARRADRIFYFAPPSVPLQRMRHPARRLSVSDRPREQTTLEGF